MNHTPLRGGVYSHVRLNMKITHALLIFALILGSNNAIADDQKSEKSVGFETVEDALTFLKTKPSVSFTVTKPDGWLIANDSSPFAVWSFTPEGHYAHPAVVKRELKQNEKGDVQIEMTALCQAAKEPCDKLINEFKEMNNQSAKNVKNKLNQ